MKKLEGRQPLCYQLEGSEKIASLTYLDQIGDLKSKALYLVKSQQKSMQFDENKYLSQLPKPRTPFVESQHFTKQVDRIKSQLSSKADRASKGSQIIPLGSTNSQKLIRSAKLMVEDSKLKAINSQLQMKFGPDALKTLINSLSKEQQRLDGLIQREQRQIQDLNQTRRYEQLEAGERQRTAKDRVRVMLANKAKIGADGMGIF